MDNKERIERAFFRVIQDSDAPVFKDAKPNDFRKISLRENLDSLGMVNLIIGLEDALRQEFDRDIPILGRSDIFNTGSLNNVGAFIDYLVQIV
jgi:hypothetical protein